MTFRPLARVPSTYVGDCLGVVNAVNKLRIGGQEFWVDNLCIGEGAAITPIVPGCTYEGAGNYDAEANLDGAGATDAGLGGDGLGDDAGGGGCGDIGCGEGYFFILLLRDKGHVFQRIARCQDACVRMGWRDPGVWSFKGKIKLCWV